MSTEEEAYSADNVSAWEMVTSSHGTYLRMVSISHNLTDMFGQRVKDDSLTSWYYDNANPSGYGNRSVPMYVDNKWAMCSWLQDGQVSISMIYWTCQLTMSVL